MEAADNALDALDRIRADIKADKRVAFTDMNASAAEFKGLLLETFPKLKDGGGYQLFKGLPNSRNLEVLSLAVHTSPSLLRQCVGDSRTYIRPIQKDLDLTSTEDKYGTSLACN